MNAVPHKSIWNKAAPGLTLMLLAPILSDVLPGATRFSAIFALPIEICMWGGGAILIRYAVRHWRLGWCNMLSLALALAVAEECVIQQTSLAPMILQIRGDAYARAFGVNYVYLLWALPYESVFVVFAPVYLTELIFPRRRDGLWLGKKTLVSVVALFLLGSILAWYSWTQLARPQAFHVPIYSPPLLTVAIALAVIVTLVFAALGPFRDRLARSAAPLKPPARALIASAAFTWATLWYGLVILAFGIAPEFPPAVAVGLGILLSGAVLLFLPRWTAHQEWTDMHQFATIFGAVLGSMLVSFIAFIGSLPMDLYFKIAVDVLAFVLLLALGARLRRHLTPP
jgi:hypothetical protein